MTEESWFVSRQVSEVVLFFTVFRRSIGHMQPLIKRESELFSGIKGPGFESDHIHVMQKHE